MAYDKEMYQQAKMYFITLLIKKTNMRIMVGTIVRGPMNRSRNPTIPVTPIIVWNSPDTSKLPWSYKKDNVHVFY